MRTNPAPLKTDRWRITRAFVAHRASLRCEHCYAFLGLTGEVDHVVPRSHCEDSGIGVFDPSNLQYLCQSCHSTKSNAERWRDHERLPPKRHVRSNIPGREAFMAATGIPETLKRGDVKC